ncbi:MAG: right-handed parallel beta-helix repeat-containing protein [Planctomycetota bacterium]
MKEGIWIGMVLGLLVVAATQSALAAPTMLYVATNGSDAWSGKLAEPNGDKTDGPFATLERARDEIRKIKKEDGLPQGGVIVELLGGRYELAKAIEMTAEDSGTADSPVVYRARPGDEVHISGGKIVTGWKPVTDPAVLNRLAPEAKEKVLQVDLKAQGIADCGTLGGRFGGQPEMRLEVFFNDEPMQISRWPNDGFIKITEVLGATEVDVRGTKGCKEGIFKYEGDRPTRWVGEKEAWVLGYWFRDWAEQRHKIKSIAPDKAIMEVEQPYHNYGYRKGQWFYGYNLLCEIDQPGEWYIDREAGMLYFWPPGDIEKGKVEVTVAPALVNMTDTTHVTFERLLFEGTRGTAMTIKNGEGCRVVGCTFRNLGIHAVTVSDGKDVGVIGCDMYGMGGGGIFLNGGDSKTLTPAGHFAENNHIHHYSRWDRMYRPAIVLGGVGNRASHNLIHNAPHMGMGFGGNDHIIEFNEIHSVCYESNDCGAIYAGRNWTMRGHILRYNYLHHICGHEGRGCVGIYLDDMFSSATITGNVFYKVTRAAFIGGGRDCTVENNIFVDCPRAMHIDCRALGWAAPCADRWIEEANTKGTISGIHYKEPPYSTRFPQLVNILEHDPKAPVGNVVQRNIFWLGDGEDVRRASHGADPKDNWWDSIADKIKPLVKFENNLVNEDPLFVEPPPKSFALRDDSPAFKLGFQRIPIEKIGLFEDARRASWPATHTVRPMPQPPAPPPKPAPPKVKRAGPPVVLKVGKVEGIAPLDGSVAPNEWKGEPIVLEQGIYAEKVSPISRAWLCHDGQNLFVAIVNDVNPAKPLRMGAKWGQDDAVEVALQNPAAGKNAPIFVLRGYPDGKFESSTEAGAPAEAVKKAGDAMKFAAKVGDAGHWSAEYCIPFAALGIDPAKDRKLAFNLSVRKTAQPLWLMWQGTGAQTWRVDNAGFIELAE